MQVAPKSVFQTWVEKLFLTQGLCSPLGRWTLVHEYYYKGIGECMKGLVLLGVFGLLQAQMIWQKISFLIQSVSESEFRAAL